MLKYGKVWIHTVDRMITVVNVASVTEYDEWDNIIRIDMLGLFQDVMRNWRSSATVTLDTDVTLHTTSSLQFCLSHIGHTLI
jgi:hypothetical protein